MNNHTPQTVSDQPPYAHRLLSWWSIAPPTSQRPVPSNLTACDVLAQLLLERLAMGIDLRRRAWPWSGRSSTSWCPI